MKRVGALLITLAASQFSCTDAGTNPWPGWQHIAYRSAGFYIPSEMARTELDPPPEGLLGSWSTFGDTLDVYFYYKPNLEALVGSHDSFWAYHESSIRLGAFTGTLMHSTYVTAYGTQSAALYFPEVADGDNQVFLTVTSGRGNSALVAEQILKSFRVQ